MANRTNPAQRSTTKATDAQTSQVCPVSPEAVEMGVVIAGGIPVADAAGRVVSVADGCGVLVTLGLGVGEMGDRAVRGEAATVAVWAAVGWAGWPS